ncbi:hypothetical protein MT418_000602 [Batrachochytrium dendrobatidis]
MISNKQHSDKLQNQVDLLTQQIELLKGKLAAVREPHIAGHSQQYAIHLADYKSQHHRHDQSTNNHSISLPADTAPPKSIQQSSARTSEYISCPDSSRHSIDHPLLCNMNSNRSVQQEIINPLVRSSNTQISSSMLTSFEHPLLSLHMSSIHAPSDILPTSPRMVLDELGPPDGQYIPLFCPSKSNQPNLSQSISSMVDQSLHHSTSQRPSNSSTPKAFTTKVQSHDCRNKVYVDRTLPSSSSASPIPLTASVSFEQKQQLLLPQAAIADQDEFTPELYTDLLKKVEQALQIKDNESILDTKLGLDYSQRVNVHSNNLNSSSTVGSSDDSVDGIDSILSQIQQAIGCDGSSLQNSSHSIPQIQNTHQNQPLLSQESHAQRIPSLPVNTKSNYKNDATSIFRVPHIEYNSLVEEDSLLERASDPIMQRYLGPNYLQPHNNQKRTPYPSHLDSSRQANGTPSHFSSSRRVNNRLNNTYGNNVLNDSQSSSNSTICDASTSNFEDQLSMASLEYLLRYSLQNPEPTDSEPTRVLDLAHIHSLPKLR